MSTPLDWRTPEALETLWAGYEHGLTTLITISEENLLEGWHVKVLYGLLQAGLHALRHIRCGWPDNDISRMAWAARNALELELWIAYVTISEENAERFHLDWLNDMSELLSKSVAVEKANAVGSETAGDEGMNKVTSFPYPDMDFGGHTVQAAEALLASHRAQNPSLPEKYLRIGEIARLLGKEEMFKSINSLLSKHIHPTAFSVLSFPSDRARLNMCTLILENGCLSLIRLVGTLDEYLNGQNLPRILGDSCGVS